jgi:uncharacterized protein
VVKPVIVVALVAIGVFTLVRPSLGGMAALRHTGRRHYGVVGAGIGFYDGILGPGTGSLLVFAVVSLLGYDSLAASAQARS